MFEFTFGDVGSGKSLKQAETVLWLLNRSHKIQKKYNLPIREVWCNFHLNPVIQEKNQDRLRYWRIPQQMIFSDYPENKTIRRNFDCVWDEMAVELPSDRWKDTDPNVRRFFAQHRKRGIQLFGNTQDFMMVDINVRRMITHVFQTRKIIGSRDPSATLPPVGIIWGLVLIWELDKALIRENADKREHVTLFPEILWITKKLALSYDTGEDINKAEKMRLQHIEYRCDKCKYVKREHIPI